MLNLESLGGGGGGGIRIIVYIKKKITRTREKAEKMCNTFNGWIITPKNTDNLTEKKMVIRFKYNPDN